MDTNFGTHIPEEVLDEFALDMLTDMHCAGWEEHLLLCELCQDRLDEADEYIRAMKSALAAFRDPATEFEKRRPLAKPMTSATHA
jgi:hypothetical protein